MKTLRIKKVAAVLMIATMMAMAAGQAGASLVPRPLPRPNRFPESGDFLGQWLGIERFTMWESVLRVL
jgi:hypothetical protein